MTRIAHNLRLRSEAQATPYSRAVAAYGLDQGDARLGVGVSAQEAGGYLKHKITSGKLAGEQLAELLALANEEELAVLTDDPQVARILQGE